MPDVEKFWESFGKGNLVNIECDGSGSVAARVLDAFGVPHSGQGIGGELKSLDIKHMDALEAIKLSLLEASAESNEIYEVMVDHSSGDVVFKVVGKGTGLNLKDSYYEIQTGTYQDDCAGVLITGGKPIDERLPPEWKAIWTVGAYAIYDTHIMVSSCANDTFKQQATIIFNDPHLDTNFEDNIKNLYERDKTNPWDEIIGWAYYVDPGVEDDPDLSISFQNTAKILLRLGDGKTLGELKSRPAHVESVINENPDCYAGEADYPSSEGTVRLELPSEFRFETTRGTKVDKFRGVIGVYVTGRRIDRIDGKPINELAAVKNPPDPGDSELWLGINNSFDEVFKLEVGNHYSVVYEDENGFKEPYIAFANNARLLDPELFKGGRKAYIFPDCAYFEQQGIFFVNDAVVLPTSLFSGILVKDIWVAVELDTPSIVVYHPDGRNSKAFEIAEKLDFQITPLKVRKMPAPIAFNGALIDQTQSIHDHDPTTKQDLEDTDYEKVLDEMAKGGNGVSLSLSFLDEGKVVKLSSALYDYLNSGDGTEATYVCGPDAEVELGGRAPNGGVVNSVTYSYQDSSSYTISVNAGSILTGGIGSFSGLPNFKVAENVSSQGTVVQDMGNHIFYKVRLDQLSEVVAVNMCHDIIRVGDIVQCTVYNNPVEQ